MMIFREKDLQEFSHFGIKGMKWGRRRYQNKDGSLTSEGKKRYDYPHQSERDRMSNADMRKAIERKKLELEYDRYFPQQKSLGERFAKRVSKDVLVPETISIGRSLLRGVINETLKETTGVDLKLNQKKKR